MPIPSGRACSRSRRGSRVSRPRALAEARQVCVDHRPRIRKRLGAGAIGVDRLYRQRGLGHVTEFTRTFPARLGALAMASLDGAHSCGDDILRREPRARVLSPMQGSAATIASTDFSRARVLADGQGELPPRAGRALALAESIEAQAVREGAGGRAVALHVDRGAARRAHLAGRRPRTRRERGARTCTPPRRGIPTPRAPAKPPSPRRAWPATSRTTPPWPMRSSTGCSVASRRFCAPRRRLPTRLARLSPPRRTELGRTCRAEVEDGLSRLSAVGPPQRVLDAIEVGLAGEGRSLQLPRAGGRPPIRERDEGPRSRRRSSASSRGRVATRRGWPWSSTVPRLTASATNPGRRLGTRPARFSNSTASIQGMPPA